TRRAGLCISPCLADLVAALVHVGSVRPAWERTLDADELRVHRHAGIAATEAPQVPEEQQLVGPIEALPDAAGDKWKLPLEEARQGGGTYGFDDADDDRRSVGDARGGVKREASSQMDGVDPPVRTAVCVKALADPSDVLAGDPGPDKLWDDGSPPLLPCVDALGELVGIPPPCTGAGHDAREPRAKWIDQSKQ